MPHQGAPSLLREAVMTHSFSAGESAAKYQGTVKQVCQRKGCWMVIADGEIFARVLFKGPGFSVPKMSSGNTAIVYGHLKRHLRAPKAIRWENADQKDSIDLIYDYQILATSAQILKPEEETH